MTSNVINKGRSSVEQWLLRWWLSKWHLKQWRRNEVATRYISPSTAGFTLRSGIQTNLHSWIVFQGSCKKTQYTLSLDNEGGVTTLGSASDQEQHHPGAINRIHRTQNRRVLTTTESMLVSLGQLSPNLIAYKIFLQKLWQYKLQCGEKGCKCVPSVQSGQGGCRWCKGGFNCDRGLSDVMK